MPVSVPFTVFSPVLSYFQPISQTHISSSQFPCNQLDFLSFSFPATVSLLLRKSAFHSPSPCLCNPVSSKPLPKSLSLIMVKKVTASLTQASRDFLSSKGQSFFGQPAGYSKLRKTRIGLNLTCDIDSFLTFRPRRISCRGLLLGRLLFFSFFPFASHLCFLDLKSFLRVENVLLWECCYSLSLLRQSSGQVKGASEVY